MQHDIKSLRTTLIINRLCIIVWTICLFIVPLIARWYDTYSNKESIFYQFVADVYLAMIPAAVILWKLEKLLTNINKKCIFVTENVTCLRVISYCCFIIAVIAFVMTYWRLLAAVIAVAFAFVGLLLRVLKNVFEQAVLLREENDLTV